MSADNSPRVVDGRKRDFFIVDNPVIDQKIEQIPTKRRADAGWTYTVLCRLADNDTGEATLRISYLEKKTGRSKPVLVECLKALKDVGLLAVTKNREEGRQSASTYVILTVTRVKDENSERRVQSKQVEGGSELTEFTANKDSVSSTKTPPPKSPPKTGGKRAKTIRAEDEPDYAAAFAEFVAEDILGQRVATLVRLAAAENKSKRKRYSTAMTGYVEVVRKWREEGIYDEQIAFGLDEAIRHNAPNMNYAKKCALGYAPAIQSSRRTESDGNPYSLKDYLDRKSRRAS